MNDKVSFVPDSIKKTVDSANRTVAKETKKIFSESVTQIFGQNSSEKTRQEKQTKELAKKAERNNKTVEEQAKIESLRKQLHQQITTPQPTDSEKPTNEEDKVGTNEANQRWNSSLTNPSDLNNSSSPRRVERLKVRE